MVGSEIQTCDLKVKSPTLTTRPLTPTKDVDKANFPPSEDFKGFCCILVCLHQQLHTVLVNSDVWQLEIMHCTSAYCVWDCYLPSVYWHVDQYIGRASSLEKLCSKLFIKWLTHTFLQNAIKTVLFDGYGIGCAAVGRSYGWYQWEMYKTTTDWSYQGITAWFCVL